MARRKKKKNKIIPIIIVIIILFSICSGLFGCNEKFNRFLQSICQHNWESGTIIKEATCLEEGQVKYVCSKCKLETIEDIEKGKHSLTLAKDSNNHWYECETCDYKTDEEEHSLTLAKDSNNHWYECETCDYKIDEEEHSLTLAKDSNNHWYECETCDYKTDEEEHNFIIVNEIEICSICNFENENSEQDLSFHFMMLGNKNAGDCIYIKAGDNDILIDAGSKANSVDDIQNYLDEYVTDNKLEYVIATHADQDHIAGFAKTDGGIFDLYECKTIIDFPLSNKATKTYQNYCAERDAEVSLGAKHYTALQCYNNQDGAQRVYNLSADGNIKMEILYNYFYENKTSDENDYSVCVMFYHGSRQFLFTGDLEEEGEEKLAQKYDFTQVELFKAGHHGSKTSSNDCLLKEIKPKICVATCCAGCVEYTSNIANTFPTQAFIDRIAPYTSKVYVPIGIEMVEKSSGKYENAGEYYALNGNIVVISQQSGVTVECSNNNTVLKDTDWFRKYRQTPTAWLN